jgi:GAF domain-containing protein
MSSYLPSESGADNHGRDTRLLLALNSAAAQLQRSARSETDVFRAFYEQIVKIGLYGSINLLSEDGEQLMMMVAAVPWENIAHLEEVADPGLWYQWSSGVQTIRFSIPVAAIKPYAGVLKNGDSVFEPDNSEYLWGILPAEFHFLAEDILSRFGGKPGIFVPLIIGGKIQGLLTVNGDGLTIQDIPAVEAFANHTAIALENARLFAQAQDQVSERKSMAEALRRRADELAILQALSLDLTTVHELPVLLRNIVEKAVQLLGAKGGSLYLCEPELEQLRLYVESQQDSQEFIGITLRYGEGAAGVVALSSQPLIIDNYRHWPGSTSVFDNVKPFTAVLTVPMIWQGEITGVLQVLDDFNYRRFTQADQELLSLFANHAAVALETTRLLEAERFRRQEAETLGMASAVLTSTLDIDDLFSVILTQLEDVVSYSSAAVFLRHDKELRIVAARGFSAGKEIVGTRILVEEDNLFLELQRQRRSIILEDVRKDPRFRGWGGVDHVRGWLGTPLIVRGEVIGCLTLDSEQPGAFHANHAALVEVFANQAAIAIEKGRLFEAEREARRHAEAMRDAAHIISSTLSITEVLQAVLDQIARVLQFDSGNIMLLEGDQVLIKVWRGYQTPAAEELVRAVHFDLSPEHAIGAVVTTRDTLMIPDVRRDLRWQTTPLSEHIRSWLGVPLIVRGQVIGLLNLDRTNQGGFSKDDIALAQTFAAHAAVAIDNARLYEQAATERRHLRLLYDIGQELTTSLDYDEILNRAISLTCQVFGGSVGQAFLYLPQVSRLKLSALYGKEDGYGVQPDLWLEIDLETGLAGWVARNRQPAYIQDISQDERWYHVPGLDEGVSSVISAPILSGEQLLGVLSVLHNQTAAFSHDQLDLLQTICHEVGLALSNADRYQEVKRRLAEITLIQNLTEIFNRRLDLQVLLDEVVQQLYERFNFPLVEIFLIRGDQLVLQAYRGSSLNVNSQSIQQGVVGRVARTGQASFISDVSQDLDYFCCSPDTIAELAVPIYREDTVIGVINIESLLPDQLTAHDCELLQVLSGQISIALENAVLYDQVRQHADELEQLIDQRTLELTNLYELSQRIAYTLGYEDLLKLLLSHLRAVVGCDLASGCLALDGYRFFFVETTRELAAEAMTEIRKSALEVFGRHSVSAQKLELAPVELIRAPDYNKRLPPLEKVASLISFPLMLGRKTVGALIVAREKENVFGDYQLRLLETFAIQAGSALERIAAILDAEQKRLEGLVEHLPVGVILLDTDYRLLVANPLARSILSALNSSLDGGYLTRLDSYPLEELIYRYRDPLPVEIISDGPPRRVFEAQVRPMGKGSQQWVMTLREVTQEREIQSRVQMQDRLATVGQLAAGIAHDFNNIMAAILVYTDLLMSDPSLPKTSHDRLVIIEQQVQRAASLIRQILDFSRRAVMEQSSLDLLPFIKELERMLGRVMPETIRLELSYKPGEYLVHADPTRLQQVFINLAVNSRDAMPQGGVLHFSIDHYRLNPDEDPPLPDLEPGEWIKITVRDSGEGIPPEVLPHIFEPFFTTKPVGQGTGLGLAQVYGIIKQHEGHIDVCSRVGEGTEFFIYLPTLPEPFNEKKHTEPLAALDGSGKVVLIVEDDQATLGALQALLEAKNYDVLTACNGYEAVQQYKRSAAIVSLVVSDVVMPQMDGVKLYRVLQELSPNIKFIFVTGHPLEGDSQILLEQGDVHWLQKPFSARDFTRMVQNLLEAH